MLDKLRKLVLSLTRKKIVAGGLNEKVVQSRIRLSRIRLLTTRPRIRLLMSDSRSGVKGKTIKKRMGK